jgi:hypothetical protein
MGLEKMGLPPKPYEKGKDWTPDSTNCEGCQAAFTWINRKVCFSFMDPLFSDRS